MRYSAERKNAALAMLQNHSIDHTSNELGIHSSTLLRWRKENADMFPSDLDGSMGEDAPVRAEKDSAHVRAAQALLQKEHHVLIGEVALLLAENERLARENTRLRMAMKELLV